MDLIGSLEELLHHVGQGVHVSVRFGEDFFFDVVVEVISNISALLPRLVDVGIDRFRQILHPETGWFCSTVSSMRDATCIDEVG